MKTKKFIIAGIVGGIVNFLLGWLFYGILFLDTFPQPEENSQAMLFIFLGCLTFGLFIAYIYTYWAQISTAGAGAKAGAIIGLFVSLFYNFFNLSMLSDATIQLAALDVGISIVMSTIVGATIAMANGKLS
tara:strand:+ start:22507 stop:22899 length:393 start_codon:yes stop_codon:yes gene_type:complete